MAIPEEFRDLFERESFACFASRLPDGSLHAVPVWVGYDGEHVLTSAAADARRAKNVRRDPRVVLSIREPDDPYRSVMVRGEVVELTTDGGEAFNDRGARQYWGVESFPDNGGTTLLVKVAPTAVVDTSSFTPEAYEP